MSEYNTDHVFTRQEWMTHFRNYWGEQFYAKVVDFSKAREKWKKNPDGKEVTQVGDQFMDVPLAQKVESLARTVKNAKDMMERFDLARTSDDDAFALQVKEIIDFLDKPKLDIIIPK